MDVRAREILAEARSTLARTASIKVEHRSHDDGDDVLVAWRRGMSPTERPVKMADVDEKISAAFKSREWQHDATMEATGIALGQTRAMLRKAFDAEIAKLRKLVVDNRHLGRSEITRLRADFDRQRASMLAEIEFQRAKIAELRLQLDGYEGKRVDGRVVDLSARRG